MSRNAVKHLFFTIFSLLSKCHNKVNLFTDHTLDLIERAGDIKKVGATGAYSKEFDEMQNQLDEIEQLLNNTEEIDIETIENELEMLAEKVADTENEHLSKLDDELDNNKQLILLKEVKISSMNDSLNELKAKIKELENNGTKLQEANVQGALTLISNAKGKADRAAEKAERSQVNRFYNFFSFRVISKYHKVCEPTETSRSICSHSSVSLSSIPMASLLKGIVGDSQLKIYRKL